MSLFVTKLLFHMVVIIHLLVVFVNCFAFFILPFTSLILNIPFWFSIFIVVPLESIILVLSFSREPCPLTRLENKLRRELGMNEIDKFIKYYIIKQKWRRKQVIDEDICYQEMGI